MCSIYGAFGPASARYYVEARLVPIQVNAVDRGRDGGGWLSYRLPATNRFCYLGCHRATPTTEVEDVSSQPYDGLVHNGIIANDEELGRKVGEVDSMVLPRVLDRSNVQALARSLRKVKGSYAIALHNGSTVLLARNYKPLYYYQDSHGVTYFSSMARHFELPFGHAPVELPPYTAIDLSSRETVDLYPETEKKRVLMVASGGLDSTVAACKLISEGYYVEFIHFLYNCPAERRENIRVTRIAEKLKCLYPSFVSVPYNRHKLDSGSLFQGEVSESITGAEYPYEWVPARNLVFLSLAIAFAEANSFDFVALGNNLEEAGAYPDNEEEFTHNLNRAAKLAVTNGKRMTVLSPVGNLMKSEIVKLGLELKAPLDLTWSCYRNGEKHCGRCGPCFMRREAFKRNGVGDVIEYE